MWPVVIVAFLLGASVGASLGIVILAALVAGKDADARADRLTRAREAGGV